ncbi:MAG: hypothetical protein J6B43_11100 [Lachnospiraceae bacterium]|nr:hypothetical protein [Lachnospiraceae bacterium]
MLLFKFGNFEFPSKYIKRDTFDIAPNQRQDLDSYTDGYGVTHRNVLSHTKTQIQFTTRKMSGAEMRSILDSLISNYISFRERDAQCTYYDDETGTYKTGHFYLDPSLQFRRTEVDESGVKQYGEMQWTFIEY